MLTIHLMLKNGWNAIELAICICALADVLISLSWEDRRVIVSPYFRPFIFALSFPSIRKSIFETLVVIYAVGDVVLLLFLITLWFDWMALIIFSGTDANTGFENFGNGLYSLLILITTDNSPDLMMPAYRSHRWTILLFIPFILIAIFFLVNLILATVFGHYKNYLASNAKSIQQSTNYHLNMAFNMLKDVETPPPQPEKKQQRNGKLEITEETKPNKKEELTGQENNQDKSIEKSEESDAIDINTFTEFLVELNNYEMLPTLHIHNAVYYFQLLDKNKDQKIEKEEFLQIMVVLHTRFVVIKPSWLSKKFPNFVKTQLFRKLYAIAESVYLDYLIGAVIVVNTIFSAVETSSILNGAYDPTNSYWIENIVEVIFSIIYLTELIFKVTILGWSQYWKKRTHHFDLAVILVPIGLQVFIFAFPKYQTITVNKGKKK